MNKLYYDYIKNEIDEFSIFEQYVQLKKAGVLYKGRCPFHMEKTPSFVVYPPSNTQSNYSFYCFGCGKGGDIIKFVQLIEDLSTYSQSALYIAKKYQLKLPEDSEVIRKQIEKQDIDINEVLLDIDEINFICSKRLHGCSDKILEKLDYELDVRDIYELQTLPDEVLHWKGVELNYE